MLKMAVRTFRKMRFVFSSVPIDFKQTLKSLAGPIQDFSNWEILLVRSRKK